MESPKLHIEALQTIVPSTVTDPRLTRKISAANGQISPEHFRGCLHLLLYYTASEGGSGWSVAGFIKGSLGMALADQPFLAGRLRQAGDGEFEVVANDSGVRLVEAKMGMSLCDVLALEGDEKEGVEDKLVFWTEIDGCYPQFSPLLYVQVTNFECGGYSVAISYSLLVADNLVITKFLNNWTNMHETIMSQNNLPKLPIFYAPNTKRTATSQPIPVNSTSSQARGRTVMFKATPGQPTSSDTCKMLALLCLEEAEREFGQNTGLESIVTLFAKERHETMMIGSCRKEDYGLVPSLECGIERVDWEGLGGKEVGFVKGSKPKHVSGWIGSISGGIVMVFPDDGDEGCSEFVNVVVTFLEDRKRI